MDSVIVCDLRKKNVYEKESGKWKTTLKMAAGSVGFLAGLCVVLILAGRFLCRKSNADIYDTTAVRTKDAEVKNEVKDTIDVVFLGDSECYSSFNPLQMFAEHGYTSFICGTSAQRMCDSYAILQAAFETQTPEVVVLETNCLFRSVKSKGDSKDYVLDRLSDHVEIFKNHSRWKDAFVSTNSLTKKKMRRTVDLSSEARSSRMRVEPICMRARNVNLWMRTQRNICF